MANHGKNCTEDFVFDKVIRRSYSVIYLVAFLAFTVAALLFIVFIRPLFFRGGLPLAFGLMVLGMMLMVNFLSRKVVIYFDEKSMYVNDQRILKSEICGIYSFNYDERQRSRISIKIVLKNGDSINLIDADLFEKTDHEKGLMLKRFLLAAKKRLGIEYSKKNRWRSAQGLGAYWYAPVKDAASDTHV